MKRSCETVGFDEPPNKKFRSRDTSCDYNAEDAKKRRSPMSLYKMKIHEAFLKVIDHAVGDFAIYGQLENAPTVVISMKVKCFAICSICNSRIISSERSEK